MLITFHCPHCESKLEIESDAAGEHMACPNCQEPITVPRKQFGPGVTIGGFRIEALVGKGAMGEVYRARQLSMDRDVALKILPSHMTIRKDLVERFLHEVHLIARLEHPNIVTAHEAGEDSGIYYMAMAYVKGEPLDIRIRKKGALSEKKALEMVKKIARALDYAWREHRLLHRDIKPSNIMLDKHGEPKLLDMGLSKSLNDVAGLTVSEMVVGTPNYMSPEQAEGKKEIDSRADMYCLGATLYHMLTGQVPFKGDNIVEILRKQATEALPDPRDFNPSISDPCVELMAIMLAKNPKHRHRSWDSLIADVDRVLIGEHPKRAPLGAGESTLLRAKEVKATEAGEHKRITLSHSQAEKLHQAGHPRPPPRRSGLTVFLGVLFAVLLLANIVLMVNRKREKKEPEPQTGPPRGPVVGERRQPGRPERRPDVRPGRGGPERPDWPERTGPDEALDRRMELERMFEEAAEHAREHPEDMAGIIEMYENVMREGRGTEFEFRARRHLRRLAARHRENVRELRTRLAREAERLAEDGRWDEAIASLREYDGPYAEETMEPRNRLADELERRAEEIRQEEERKSEEQRVEEAHLKLAALREAVANDLLKMDFNGARAWIANARGDESLDPIVPVLDELDDITRKVAEMPDIILDSFRADEGKEIRIGFKDGNQQLTIVSVSGGEIRARKELRKAGFAQRDFKLEDLSYKERFKRLGREQTPELDIMRGLILYQYRKPLSAQKYFQRAGGLLGEELAALIERRRVGAREAEAKKAYGHVLRAASLSPDVHLTEDLVEAVRRTDYAPEDVGRIQETVRRFLELYGDTDTAREAMPLLDALGGVSTIPSEIEPSVLDKLSRALEHANPGASITPLIEMTEEGLEIDLSDNRSLKDIGPLAGLPITRLDLSETSVSDLAPLQGMPLKWLGCWDTQVADLSPLEGMGLEVLNVACTSRNAACVTDLSPLKGMPLKWLDLYSTRVSDLRPLKDMPLEFLKLHNANDVRDIRALRGLPLRKLDLRSTKVSELRPLAGMSLTNLYLGGTRVVELRPLRGMPLERLDLGWTPAEDFSPLEGMPLKWLNVQGNQCKDFMPLAGMESLEEVEWIDGNYYLFVLSALEPFRKRDYDRAEEEARALVEAFHNVPAFSGPVREIRTFISEIIPMCRELAPKLRDARGDLRPHAKSFRGHHYVLVPLFMEWHEAREYCEKHGGHLATITSQGEQEWILHNFRIPGSGIWLGGTRLPENRGWHWITDEPLDYKYWLPHEPNNFQGVETVAAMFSHGLWFDAPDHWEYPFILEWDD